MSFKNVDAQLRAMYIALIRCLTTWEQLKIVQDLAMKEQDTEAFEEAQIVIGRLMKPNDGPVMREQEFEFGNPPRDRLRAGLPGLDRHGTGLPPTSFGRPFPPPQDVPFAPLSGADLGQDRHGPPMPGSYAEEEPFASLGSSPGVPITALNDLDLPGRTLVGTPDVVSEGFNEAEDQRVEDWLDSLPDDLEQKPPSEEEDAAPDIEGIAKYMDYSGDNFKTTDGEE